MRQTCSAARRRERRNRGRFVSPAPTSGLSRSIQGFCRCFCYRSYCSGCILLPARFENRAPSALSIRGADLQFLADERVLACVCVCGARLTAPRRRAPRYKRNEQKIKHVPRRAIIRHADQVCVARNRTQGRPSGYLEGNPRPSLVPTMPGQSAAIIFLPLPRSRT